MGIKEFQKEQKDKYYEYVKEAILSDIKLNIKNDPKIEYIDYCRNSSFIVRQLDNHREPIWIYSKIDMFFDRLKKDLKLDGVELRKIEVYEDRKVGLFKKGIIKEFVYDYYKLSW